MVDVGTSDTGKGKALTVCKLWQPLVVAGGETYGDLRGIPLLLIICGKGRMGDTFPETLAAFDLRLRLTHSKVPTKKSLASLQQELGRVCGYGAGRQSYALVPADRRDQIESNLTRPGWEWKKVDGVMAVVGSQEQSLETTDACHWVHRWTSSSLKNPKSKLRVDARVEEGGDGAAETYGSNWLLLPVWKDGGVDVHTGPPGEALRDWIPGERGGRVGRQD